MGVGDSPMLLNMLPTLINVPRVVHFGSCVLIVQ